MSGNKFIDQQEVVAREALESLQDKPAREDKQVASAQSRRTFVQIMNGEFLSRDNFVKNLPFVFFLGFLLVVLIGWGYYAETVTKREVQLEKELGELNSEYSTLRSIYNEQRGRPTVANRLLGTGVEESLIFPRKIRVRKYVFEGGR